MSDKTPIELSQLDTYYDLFPLLDLRDPNEFRASRTREREAGLADLMTPSGVFADRDRCTGQTTRMLVYALWLAVRTGRSSALVFPPGPAHRVHIEQLRCFCVRLEVGVDRIDDGLLVSTLHGPIRILIGDLLDLRTKEPTDEVLMDASYGEMQMHRHAAVLKGRWADLHDHQPADPDREVREVVVAIAAFDRGDGIEFYGEASDTSGPNPATFDNVRAWVSGTIANTLDGEVVRHYKATIPVVVPKKDEVEDLGSHASKDVTPDA